MSYKRCRFLFWFYVTCMAVAVLSGLGLTAMGASVAMVALVVYGLTVLGSVVALVGWVLPERSFKTRVEKI